MANSKEERRLAVRAISYGLLLVLRRFFEVGWTTIDIRKCKARPGGKGRPWVAPDARSRSRCRDCDCDCDCNDMNNVMIPM